MINNLTLLTASAISLVAIGTASAVTVTLVNADFESTAATGANQPIDGWVEFDSLPANDANYTGPPTDLGGTVTKDGVVTGGIYGAIKGGDDNWIGQNLTTTTAGALDASTFGEFDIDFQLGARNDATQFAATRQATIDGSFNTLRFALWNTTTNLELAGNTIVLGDPGVAGVALTAQSVNLSYDNTSVTAGDTLQFRITNLAPTPSLAGNFWQRTAIVDDVSIDAVPEPSSLMLLALSGLALTARRRK